MSALRQSDWEHSQDRELYGPPEQPFTRLRSSDPDPDPETRIIILEPAKAIAEAKDDAAERLALLRATLAGVTPKDADA